MQALDFFGGKYQRGSQILSGTIQTFRAFDTSSGREVFVHRVASTEPAAQQLALLLSTALIRSPKVRRLVLDVAEQDGYAHVVTDTEHQCLLLREWLQFEINQSGASAPSFATHPTPAQTTRPTVAPNAPEDDATLPAVPVSEKPTDPKLESQKPEPPKSRPGEFTRLFMAAMPRQDIPKPVAEPGEFTSFLGAGSRAPQGQAAHSPGSVGVQRPGSPVAPPVGEIFADDAPTVPPPQTIAPPKQPVSDDPLARATQYVPPPQPASAKAGPSEHTLVTSGRVAQSGSRPSSASAAPSQTNAKAAAIPLPQVQVNTPSVARSANVATPKTLEPAPNLQPTPISARTAAPPPNQGKLILLFVILGVLALALIVLIVLLLNK
jgi:hypothetical protein